MATRSETRLPGVEPGLPFDYVQAKVRVPVPRPGCIVRTALVNRLRGARSLPVVVLVAPAGYGKTTVLAQWADRDERRFAWVSLDERDNEPIVLLRHVAAALHHVEPLGASVLRALRSPGRSPWTAVVPRLTGALAALESPHVLVLDGVGFLRSQGSVDVVSALIEHVPEGSTLALAGRVASRLPIASLRPRGGLLEIGPDLLALSRREAERLLEATGVELSAGQVRRLLLSTEGWAAGLYLAALAFRDGAGAAEPAEFGGDDRYLAEYFGSEFLAGLPPRRLAFLRRTSILERLSGPLCDAVLERTDSARELDRLVNANLLLVPVDRRGEWHRYHGLFRDLLKRDAARYELDSLPRLHRRAADWFEAHEEPESALPHAAAAGETDRVARLLGSLVLPACDAGRLAAAESWLGLLHPAELERHPAVAVLAAWVHALRGRSSDAERLLEVAEAGTCEDALPDGSVSPRPWIALVRAALCREGPERMRVDAELALADLPAASRWRPTALLLQGVAHALLGDDERADDVLAFAASDAEARGAADARVTAIAERAVLAAARHEHAAAELLAHEARDLASAGGIEGNATTALALAVAARVLLRRGGWDEARTTLASARRLCPSLTQALPWLAVQTRLELVRVHLTLRDADGARLLLMEVDQVFRRRPELGVLCAQRRQLAGEVESVHELRLVRESGLTRAELRLLPMLSTHLSFREIGERLNVSRNTIKTQAISVYRKLGVASRSEAIDRASRLGLIGSTADEPSGRFIPTG